MAVSLHFIYLYYLSIFIYYRYFFTSMPSSEIKAGVGNILETNMSKLN